MSPYEFIEHTADIAVQATGADLSEAFASAAQAMFAIITGDAEIRGETTVEFQVEAIDLPGLLVGFLSELIVLHDGDGMIWGEFVVRLDSLTGLSCRASGEPFDRKRHGEGVAVKGVSYHMLEIAEPTNQEPASVKVLFDI